MDSPLPRVGWKEWVHLPELDIGPINAKIDTGARTSALHAYDVQMSNGRVSFKVHTIQGRDDFFVAAEAALIDERMVRDSGGKETRRPVISTLLRICGQDFPIEVTLIDRQEMSHRMLVGRSAISGQFLVDTGTSFVGGVPATIKEWKTK